MKSVFVALSLVALATAAPFGVSVSGPSGVVTDHGPIGPAHGYAHAYDGEDDGSYHGEGAYHHVVHAAPVAHVVHAAPAVAHVVHAAPVAHVAPVAYVAGPVAYGHGYAAHGHGDGYVAVGHHGVHVQGPHTVPAVVSGPSGKVVADGLYGVSHYGHHY